MSKFSADFSSSHQDYTDWNTAVNGMMRSKRMLIPLLFYHQLSCEYKWTIVMLVHQKLYILYSDWIVNLLLKNKQKINSDLNF